MMETPQLDLTSELLGVYGAGEDASSESADGSEEQYDSSRPRNSNYFSNPRKVKVALGQHRRKITKRTRFPLKWNRIRTFKDTAEAEAFIHNFEGFNWRKGCNNKTSYGLKAYYICKESPVCKVMSLLHYDNKAKQVDVYRSDREHYHGLNSSLRSVPLPTTKQTVGITNGGEKSPSSSAPPAPPEVKLVQIETKFPEVGKPPEVKLPEVVKPLPAPPNVEVSRSTSRPIPVPMVKRKSGGGRRRGLSDETISIIYDLFAMDPHIKPSQVQEQLKKNGIPLLQNYHINNFLVKLRKQSRLASGQSESSMSQHQSVLRSSTRLPPNLVQYNNGGYDGNGIENGHEDYYSDDANNSNNDTWFGNPHPMSMVDINLKNPFDDDLDDGEEMDEDDLMDGDELFDTHGAGGDNKDNLLGLSDSVSVTISSGSNISTSKNNSFPTARRTSSNSASSSIVLPSTTTTTVSRNNQSEVVSTSNISRPRKRNFYFRDETTKDGDDISPTEDNIKGMIIQHIQDNYSNRDLLHIREELQTLKDQNKFRALNRLLSFTAGFLQDTFIEVTAQATGSNNTAIISIK